DRLIEKRKHAMELYEMTNRYDAKLQRAIKDDPVISTLSLRKEKMEKTRDILIDNSLTSFVFVLNPEKLPIEETKKAIAILNKYGITIKDIVVNRILPDGLFDEFWQRRKMIEQGYLEEIENS